MEQGLNKNLIIDEGFKNLIRPLYRQEYLQLEANLLADGCRTPISVWDGVIVDGHNRYEICTRHGIPFEIEEMSFECREAAIAWICANQLGRRNLTEETRKFLIGMQYENEKIVNSKKNPYGINQYSDVKNDGPIEENNRNMIERSQHHKSRNISLYCYIKFKMLGTDEYSAHKKEAQAISAPDS